MTGTGPEPPAWRLRWAAEQLGVSGQASAAEARAAFLRRLPLQHFVPESSQRLALGLLCRRPGELRGSGGADEEAWLAEEERLRGLTEDFADRYWTMPPQERRCQWQELARACTGFPALEARLRSLQAGLDVAPRLDDETDAYIREIGKQVLDFYVQRPADRGPARQVLIRRMLLRMHFWQETARQLQERHPEVARLQGELIEGLATWRTHHRQLEKNRKQLRRKPAAASSGGGGYKGWGWGAGVALFLVFRFMIALFDHSSPSTPPAADFSKYQKQLAPYPFKVDGQTRKGSEPDLGPGMLKTDEQARKILEQLNQMKSDEGTRKAIEDMIKSLEKEGNNPTGPSRHE
jgi:hypothetical protein